MKVCLDAGHGNGNTKSGKYDSGAVSAGVAEADVTLAWCLTGKWIARQLGIDVFLTRDDDRDDTPVGKRDDQAEAAGCTHFIAVHCNSSPSSSAAGCESFYRDGKDKSLAELALDCCSRAMGTSKRGVKTEGQSQHSRLAVFDFHGPATLLEIGFVTNPTERARMQSRDVRVRFWFEFFKALRGGA